MAGHSAAAPVQIILSLDNVLLALTEDDCFCVSWNETLLKLSIIFYVYEGCVCFVTAKHPHSLCFLTAAACPYYRLFLLLESGQAFQVGNGS